MAKEYSQRPSSYARIDPDAEPWLAFAFDQSVWMFGTWVDGKLAERTEPVKTGKKKGETKPKFTLEQLLAEPPEPGRIAPPPRKNYRSARALVPPKVIP